jgi:hypothetical protein
MTQAYFLPLRMSTRAEREATYGRIATTIAD